MPDLSQAIPKPGRIRATMADDKTAITSRVPISRDRSSIDPTKERLSRSRVASIGAQGTLRRTSLTTRRVSTTSTTESKPISANSYQPLQRKTTTRLTATETKPITRISRTSLASQETLTGESTSGRTSLLAKRTVATTNSSNPRSKRTPLVTRKSSISTPVTAIRSQINTVSTASSTDSIQSPIPSKGETESGSDKPNNKAIHEVLASITTPRRGTPKRQARSTARKNRRGSFIEGVKTILPLDAKSNNQDPSTSAEQMENRMDLTSEPLVDTATSISSVDQASLALHAPTANERKRKAPEELAATFKKISRNTYMANTIFLSDMPLHVSRGEISALINQVFADFLDNISQIKIMSSAQKRSSGIAYVVFKSRETAIQASDAKPQGDMKICLMGSPEHMRDALDTSLDPSSKEYARNVTIERLLSIYSVLKEQGPISTSQIVNQLPPPAQKYLTEDGKELPISSLFKREFGGLTKAFNTEPMCRVFRVMDGEITILVPTFEEAKEILLTHQEGSKRPHVTYPNPSGLPRNVYDAQHVRAFAKLVFDKLKGGMKLKLDRFYEQLGYPKYTDHHGDEEKYKKLIHFWFRSARRFFTIMPMAQIFTVHPNTGEISLKLRAPTLVQYKLDTYKVCERDQGPNRIQRELDEQKLHEPLE